MNAKHLFVVVAIAVAGAVILWPDSNQLHIEQAESVKQSSPKDGDLNQSNDLIRSEINDVVPSGAGAPEAEPKWWDDEEKLELFYILFDQALLDETIRTRKVLEIHKEFRDTKSKNLLIKAKDWASGCEDPQRILDAFQAQDSLSINFCWESIERQKWYDYRDPPVDLRNHHWYSVFETIPFQFHPKYVIQQILDLETAPVLSPVDEQKVLEVQADHMVLMALLQAKTDTIVIAYSKALEGFPEPLPADSDLIPHQVNESIISLSDAVELYISALQSLELDLQIGQN